MNVERVTWLAVSGALFTVFWPWTVMQTMISLGRQPGTDRPEAD